MSLGPGLNSSVLANRGRALAQMYLLGCNSLAGRPLSCTPEFKRVYFYHTSEVGGSLSLRSWGNFAGFRLPSNKAAIKDRVGKFIEMNARTESPG